jgi:hypothetical protein
MFRLEVIIMCSYVSSTNVFLSGYSWSYIHVVCVWLACRYIVCVPCIWEKCCVLYAVVVKMIIHTI